MSRPVKKVSMQTIETLRKECQANKVFDAVCHVFALRKRTRSRVSVLGLQQAMEAEGFGYTREDYRRVLAFLASQGIGTLQKSRQGTIRSLEGIDITLQSLGKAAVTKEGELKPKAPKARKYSDIKADAEKIHTQDFLLDPKQKSIPKPLPIRKPSPYPSFLTVLIEGKPVVFTGPQDLTPETLADFLVDFRKVSTKTEVSQ